MRYYAPVTATPTDAGGSLFIVLNWGSLWLEFAACSQLSSLVRSQVPVLQSRSVSSTPSSTFMQDGCRVSSCRTQKNVINCGVLMRVAPNLGAITGIHVNFELLCNLTNCCFDRLFIRLDGAPRKVPHVGAWDRKAASVISQLHEDSAIWSLKDHRRGSGSAHLRINYRRGCQLVSPNATRLLVPFLTTVVL